jgi:hypothetical protein
MGATLSLSCSTGVGLDVVSIAEQLSHIGWEWVVWFQEDALCELSKQSVKPINISFSFLFSYRTIDHGYFLTVCSF